MNNARLFLASISKANFLHSKQSFLFLLLYLSAGIVIFGVCAFFALKYQHVIYDAVLWYLFPSSWHRAADVIVDFFFESQSKIVLAGLISGLSLVMASLFLFPLKEKCSAAYESALTPNSSPNDELHLWTQATEESKLLLLYVTSQMIILAIGYYPFVYTKLLAEALSILFLSFTFGIDFIAPTLQRHHIKYNAIIRLLLKRFFSTLCWGALFALPVLYIGKFLLSHDNFTLIEVSAYIFILNVIFLSLAIAPGTYIASAILPQAHHIQPISPQLKKCAYAGIGLCFTAGLIFHSSVFMSAHHKSQVLKMHYRMDWKNADVDMDSIFTIFKEEGSIAIRFPLEVENPTAYDFELEDSFIVIKQEDREIAHMAISRLAVPAGQAITQDMRADIHISGKSLSGFRDLMLGWNAYLEYELLPGIPLILQIM